MGDFPLPRIVEFLLGVVPFDTLTRGELEEMAGSLEVDYHPRGEVIITAGGSPAEHLHIIHAGSVRITLPQDDGGEMLIDVRGEGETFGALSLLQGKRALFTVIAQEDLLAFLLPAEAFRRLVETKPGFEGYFSHSLARNLQAARETAPGGGAPGRAAQPLGELAVQVHSRVSDLMNANVITCRASSTAVEAAKTMTRHGVGSAVVVDGDGRSVGMLTDTDLRARVLAAGLGVNEPVGKIMSQPLKTISARSYAFEAMLEMTRHGVHHLVATEGGEPVGVISDHDIKVITGSSPVGLMQELDKVGHVAELARLPGRIDRVLEALHSQGGSAGYMLQVATEFQDRVLLKLSSLVETELRELGLGEPLGPLVWVALGADARGEGLGNLGRGGYCLVHAGPTGREQTRWLMEYASRLNELQRRTGLARLLPLGPGQGSWLMDEAGLKERLAAWLREPDPSGLAMAGPLFDAREVAPQEGFVDELQAWLFEALSRNRRFLRFLARHGAGRPPLGFLRGRVVHHGGGMADSLDLWGEALAPLTNGVRVLALDLNLAQPGTQDRLGLLAQAELLERGLAEDLREVYGVVAGLAIQAYLAARREAEPPAGEVDPGSLTGLQRKMLKDAFAAIVQLREALEKRYGQGSGRR